MKRYFTRADVEARCLQIHPNSSENETTRILSVGLLGDMPFVIWSVIYVKYYKEGTPYEQRTRLFDLYREEQFIDHIVLMPISEKLIPAGCTSVEEEDKAMKAEVRNA